MDIATILFEDVQKAVLAIGEKLGQSVITISSEFFNQLLNDYGKRPQSRETIKKVAPIIGVAGLVLAFMAFKAYDQSLNEQHD